ncbi:MerR family transcriptional regulator [Desulfosarcina alkanivorans]|uniref:MerR family transcriptional regulator n=1 Tax=Desulfosarcina alkanivorans TaxID=571177 RepID=A0A5K7YJW9_9BACT|nr:MerR family transcriptional regulator [Desulfosarcina alkanivorans]
MDATSPVRVAVKKTTYAISDLSAELSITSRAIRFYEEKGLIQPLRTTGNQRRYTRKDRTRLKLILRGKRFGYTLDEIARMIGLADVDINEIDQIRNALAYGDKKLAEIRHRRKELEDMEADMIRVRQRLTTRLKELEKEKNHV